MNEHWQGRRVLITGISGFLGSWLARKLLERQADVHGFDLETVGCLSVHGIERDVTVEEGSVMDLAGITTALDRLKINTCFHLAGQSMIEGAAERPLAAWETNVQGTWTVLEACRTAPTVKAVATASSNHTYGPQATAPFTEDQPFNQLDVYGASKACADLVTRTYAQAYDMNAVAVRNTNTFGGGDPHNSHIVTGTVLSVLNGERPVVRSDGSPAKGYLYVEDTVEGYIRAAENANRKDVRGQAFNITADPISVLDLVNAVLRVAEAEDLEPIVQGRASGNRPEVEHLSGEKAKRVLGWTPRLSLDDGIRKTLDWYRQHGPLTPRHQVHSGKES